MRLCFHVRAKGVGLKLISTDHEFLNMAVGFHPEDIFIMYDDDTITGVSILEPRIGVAYGCSLHVNFSFPTRFN
jgi:hypothetical protein